MSYIESARIVMRHVTEGVRMAEKANLPAFIRDFILTHHGRGVTKYFYIKYKNEHPDINVDARSSSIQDLTRSHASKPSL